MPFATESEAYILLDELSIHYQKNGTSSNYIC